MRLPLGAGEAWGVAVGPGDDGAAGLRALTGHGPRLSRPQRRLFETLVDDLVLPGMAARLLLPGGEPIPPADPGEAQEAWVAPNSAVAARARAGGARASAGDAPARASAGTGGAWVGSARILGWGWPNLTRVRVLEPGHPDHRGRPPLMLDQRRLAVLAAEAHGAQLEWGAGIPSLGGLGEALEKEDARWAAAPLPDADVTARGLAEQGGWIRRRAAEGPVLVWAASRGVGPLWCPSCRRAVACPFCGATLLARRDWRVACPDCGRDWPEFRRCPEDGEPLSRARGGVEEVVAWARGRGIDAVGVEAAHSAAERREALRRLAEGEVGLLATTVWETLRAEVEGASWAIPDAAASLAAGGHRAVEDGWWRLFTLRRHAEERGGRLAVGLPARPPAALRSVAEGDPGLFWREESQVRRAVGLPPAADLIRVATPPGEEVPVQVAALHPGHWTERVPWPGKGSGNVVLLRGDPGFGEDTLSALRAWADASPGRVRIDWQKRWHP